MRPSLVCADSQPSSSVCRVLADGARVRIDDDQVHVCDSEGRLLVRYRDGHAEIAAPAGDLRLSAPAGAVVVSGAAVRVAAEGELALSGRSASLEASTVKVIADRLVHSVETLSVKAAHYELAAERIVEAAEDVLREVRGRLMTKAERLRTVVSGAAIFTAERTEIRSEHETVVDGARILLG